MTTKTNKVTMLCGIDEAGRGCVAGSLFMAAVILPSDCIADFALLGIKDSKKLSFAMRNEIAQKIMTYLNLHRGFYKIIQYDAKQIDSLGLKHCLKESLQELYHFAIQKDSHSIIFDGNTNFGITNVSTLIKGDSLNILIGAASILAKFSKDKEMLTLHEIVPQYDFKNNKGYLTKTHKQRILKFGYCDFHRKSYRISFE
ncbi:ribonuclease HII [Helicobacter aurati]|uniref:Ribonuclease n=1 Tax=Helicobacter aurati TaxID=137778 RepID=A0A3D8J651_9HELI|nr:ribonuclease HII [Helicobacter aurati]RDU72750.1 ribonuclease HII [Helicobacter aurati]